MSDTAQFRVMDFDCPTCANTIERALSGVDGVESVEVTSHVSEVPDGGPSIGALQQILDGSVTAEQRDWVSDTWHGRVEAVLSDDSLFTVEAVNAE